jgi:hypothetical protein
VSRNDWLVPMDDILTGRLRMCTLCGRRAEGRWVDVAMIGTLAIGYVICDRCRASDPKHEALIALMEQRYAPKGDVPLSKVPAQIGEVGT